MSDKMLKHIMVCENEKLFKGIKRESKLYTNSEIDFEKRVNEVYAYMVRGRAEEDFNYKQPLPYGVVVDDENRIFVYKRGGANSNNGESRLNNKISFGVGGHIDKGDFTENILRNTLKREIEEEINIKEDAIKSVDIIGYINIDDGEVQELHLGLAYLVRVHNTNVELLDGELDNGEFVSIEKLEEMMNSEKYDLEKWSRILFETLKELLK